jgi:hypothetical protein
VIAMVFGVKQICGVCKMTFKTKRMLTTHERLTGHNTSCQPVLEGEVCDQPNNVSEELANGDVHGDVPSNDTVKGDDVHVGKSLQTDENECDEVTGECSTEVRNRSDNCEQSSIVETIRHGCSIKTLKEMPVRGMSGTDFCRRIAAANNMMAISVPGDGSCQYHAVLKGLQAANYWESFDVEQLRVRVLDELIGNHDMYLSFLAGNEESIEQYAADVVDRQWGDEVALAAMASALRICIVVYKFSYQRQQIHRIGSEDSDYCVYLTLDKKDDYAAHYGALIPCVDDVDGENDVEMESDDESTCEVFPGISGVSCADSLDSSLTGVSSCRKADKVKKLNRLHTDELFKVPQSPVSNVQVVVVF